ncbi:MAG: response regulator [Ardenticatenaceae bacterium]|nr:response regulator [Anaerolineales bacterium]MCB8941966.1 response regulator [Ardenticatenaceae bacterium]MCB8973079.1 response regulator [Ardenticatenaceae bacterium]
MGANALNILVIDDQKHDFRLVARALTRSNKTCKVSWARRGEEALGQLQRKMFDVAVLDYNLPGMDGLETLQKIRTFSQELPTIFITGSGDEQTAVRALKLGANDYLVKDSTGNYLDYLPTIVHSTYRQLQEKRLRQKVSDALKERDERLRATIASMDDLVFVIDKNGDFMSYYQPPGKNPLSATPEFFLGQSYHQILPSHVSALIDVAMEDAGLSNEPQHFEYSLESIRKTFWFSAKLTLRKDRQNRFNGATIVVRDITEIKQAAELLRSYNAELEIRVQERTRELTQANERLKELDILKTKLIDDLTHELRTPITNFKLYLDLMHRNKQSDKFEQYHEVLVAHTNRLEQLIEDIVKYSQIPYGKEAFSTVHINRIAAQVIAWHQPQTQMAGVQLMLETCAENAVCWGNEQQLITMITNLVKNGVNYTPKGSVLVRISMDDQNIILEVKDTGIGIAEEEMDLIFDRFYRGKKVGQLTIPGSGIGLALTKEIVLQHKGTIRVESKVSEGTTFYVTLPRADVASTKDLQANQQDASRSTEPKTNNSFILLNGDAKYKQNGEH